MRHSEKTIYIATVLWLKGHTVSMVSYWCGLRLKQVAGIIDRTEYNNRSAMTLQERQEALDLYREARFGPDGRAADEGALDKIDWVALPLEQDQERRRGTGLRSRSHSRY